MTLPAGTRLGPYDIVGPLGAGGMGEVYRARDTRLNREVAIKVLPADVASDRERLARFEREAKAVSALNHPNIVTLYEVGSSDAGPYLVLERVDGQSLRTLIDTGPLALKRLLDLGAQIAAGLAKAHAAGIVHRDLKPDNVMVTADGFAKILDFGLARLVWPDEGLGDAADTATFVKETASGLILGTLGYLSPEQAAGKPADYRADQFAFGALLYEMATGVRPFKRATMAESLTATIREDPEPVSSKRPDLPSPVAWLIERCLAKDPEARYASTKDLARDLADIRDRLSEIARMPAIKPGEDRSDLARSRLMRWVLGVAAVGALIAGTFVVAKRTATVTIPSFQPLTFQRGTITGARFGRDANTVYYSAAYGDGPSQVFVTQVDRTESKLLEVPPGFLMGVSKKDELLILRTEARTCCGAAGVVARVPALGGAPRGVLDNVTYADWAADGERIALARDRGRCEFFEGRAIAATCGQLRVSPVNDDVAFVSGKGLVIEDAQGRQLAAAPDWPRVFGLAWTPDGREVWYTASQTPSAHDRALRALSKDGSERLIARAPGALTVYDVAPGGKALIATGAGWSGINAVIDGSEERQLDLNGRTQIAGLTPNGRLLLLNEEREVGRGVYLRSTDGKQTVQLSKDAARGLLPDGLSALVQPRDNPSRLELISTGPGKRRAVQIDPGLEVAASGSDAPAQWALDSHRMFMLMRPVGAGERAARIYYRDDDGPWHPVTPDISPMSFAVSPTGDVVAANEIAGDKPGSVVLYSVDGRTPTPLESELGRPVHWGEDGRLLLAAPDPVRLRLYHRDLKTGRVEPWRTIGPADPTAVMAIGQVFVSSDERSYVYQYMRGLNDLYLVRDLK